MSGPVLLFKAKDDAVIKAWEDANKPLFDEWRAQIEAVKAELGVENMVRRDIGFGEGWVVSGYVEPDRKADPKPGFRRDAKSGFMVPAKRTVEGKEWSRKLSAISYQPTVKPGLPKLVLGGGYMGHFRIEEFRGRYFAWLGFDPYEPGRSDDNSGMCDLDPDVWAEAKFSEYYAAKEASNGA